MALQSQGRFDLYFVSSLCTELNRVFNLDLHHYLLSLNDPKPLFDFNTLSQNIQKRYEKNAYTQDSFTEHMRIFTEERDTSVLLQNLIRIEQSIKSALFRCDQNAIELLKRLFISLIGHHEPKVREKAVVYLNVLSDGVEWQLESAFNPQISTVNNQFKVSYIFQEKDEPQDVMFLLNSLSFDLTEETQIFSWHKVEITKSTINPDFVIATVDLGSFPRAGFYDWRFVKLSKKGKIVCINSGAFSSHEINDINELLKNQKNTDFAQGRFIVHPKHTRDLEIHEITADYPKGVPGELYRGSFGKIKENFHQYIQMGINCLYIMGALERDHGVTKNPNTGKIMYKRTDVSPAAVTCRKTMNSLLGGKEEFLKLMETAKENDLKIMIDCFMRVSSSRPNQRYKNLLLQWVDEDGLLEYAYGSEGRGRKYNETIYLNYRFKVFCFQ